MFKLSGIFTKLKSLIAQSNDAVPSNNDTPISSNTVKTVKNWYQQRYDTLTVQRNILFVLLIILLFLAILSVITVIVIMNFRKFDPFVIQVDQNTGIAKVVNPSLSGMLDGNEALARYFIKKYVSARETYNPVDFYTEARKNIRLFSSNDIYWQYIGYIQNKAVDPTIIYGQKNTTFLMVKSWTKLDQKRYMLRFSINETSENKKIFHKLAVIDFDYIPMTLTDAERDINPLGFQVKGYRVDDDNS